MVKVKNLVRFGFCSKKLIFPFGVAFCQILINISNIIFDEAKRNNFLESIDSPLSQMAIALIPFFLKFSFQTKTNTVSRRSRCKSFLHFFILYFIFGTFLALNIIKTILFNKFMQQLIQQNKMIRNHQNTDLSSFESLEIIFICIVSIVLLKYKYFIHHTISIIIFILTNIGIDLLLGKFQETLDKGVAFLIINTIFHNIKIIKFKII